MSTENEHKEPAPPVPSTGLVGVTWTAKINGRKHINGERYCATIFGEAEVVEDDVDIYEVLRGLADHIAEKNEDMQYPDSMQVTLTPTREV